MDPAILFAVLMAMLAYSCIAVGEVMMKKGISWLGWTGGKDVLYYRSRRLWLLGLILVNLYGIPSAVALRHLSAHVMGAFSGWVVVLLVCLSHRVLKEKLTRADRMYALLFVVGIVALNLLEKPVNDAVASFSVLAALSLLPLGLLSGGMSRGVSRRIRTIACGIAAGMSAGLMVIYLRLLVLEFRFSVLRYFESPWLYLYVFFALLSLVALQLAFKSGGMILTTSMKYSAAIITPFLGAVAVFPRPVNPWQWAAAALIVFAVIRLIPRSEAG